MQVGTKALMFGAGVAVGAAGMLLAHHAGLVRHDHLDGGHDDDVHGATPSPAGHDHASHDHGTGSTISPAPPLGGGYDKAVDAPNSAGSGVPLGADGPGNLAVAWWPQDISLTQQGDDAVLRFQSTVVNLGGEAVAVRPGDRVEYTVMRSDSKGNLGEVVARGSAPLDRADVKPFPVEVGVDIGVPISDLGKQLHDISSLAPQHAAIVGAGHASQAITISDATAGTYTLRQQVVHADGSSDIAPGDDARLTEFRLDGAGSILHLGSRYAD